jgi:hypothetical protein
VQRLSISAAAARARRLLLIAAGHLFNIRLFHIIRLVDPSPDGGQFGPEIPCLPEFTFMAFGVLFQVGIFFHELLNRAR